MMVLNVQYSSRQTTHGVQKLSPISSPRASPSRLQIRPLTFDETVLGSTSTNSRATQRRAHHHTAVPAAAKGLTEILLEHPAETPAYAPPTALRPTDRRYDRDLPPLDHESTRTPLYEASDYASPVLLAVVHHAVGDRGHH